MSAESSAVPTWREQAVARSLDPARARAEQRLQRFLDAAMELLRESPEREFTVQEVVERSGQSLRSFYQYFAGKHELLLALFEETIRSSVDAVMVVTDKLDEPFDRLHAFTVEYYRMCRPSRRKGAGGGRKAAGSAGAANAASVMADFAQQLLTRHPEEATRAFAPLVEAYEQLLDEAADAGSIRTDLDARRVTGIVLQTVMFSTFAGTISGSAPGPVDRSAEEVWSLVLGGLQGS